MMARKRQSKNKTTKTDGNQEDVKPSEVQNGNYSTIENGITTVKTETCDHKGIQEWPPLQKESLEVGTEEEIKSPAKRRPKRKLPQTQTPESDYSESKRRQTDSTVYSESVSIKKKTTKKSLQSTKQSKGARLRCRTKTKSQEQSLALSPSADFEERKPSSKSRKTRVRKGRSDHDQVSSLRVESKSAVKPESKVEGASAVKSSEGAKKLVGAHCSVAGGLYKAVEEAVDMGGRAFGLFLRSQRSWNSKPLDPEVALKFKASCKEHGFAPNSILPHGSYLMNCGSPNPDTLQKSRQALLEEMQRCEALGLTLYNFHPGSTCGEISIEECLDKIADAINWAHEQTKFVITVVENMSCQGNTVGGRFEELKGIIDRVKDKSRIGVCLDTCHAFAAGYDLSSEKGFERFVSEFDSIVGFQYLKAMHLNDSKGAVGCHLDRHENIGKGQIGVEGFRRVMTEPRFDGIPMILETPVGNYAREIKMLNKLNTA